MKVSIIIPVYNVEKYLSCCVDSVLSQTYSKLEIILVNDGSTDASGNICEQYKDMDNRIRIIHKTNGGLSSARNVGIDAASGELLFFLDSDDYLSTNCIAECVEMISQYDADIAIVKMVHVSEDMNDEISSRRDTEVLQFTTEQAIEESLYQKYYTCCAPAKLYKKKVIDNIRFPEGRLSEDLATCHLFLNNSKRIVYSTTHGYFYRQRKNSIMHVFNPRRLDALEWALEIEHFCKENYPCIIQAAICRTFNVSVHLLFDLPNSGSVHDQYYPLLWKEIKRTRLHTILNKHARNREKIAAVLSFFGEKTLRSAWNSGFAIKNRENDSK